MLTGTLVSFAAFDVAYDLQAQDLRQVLGAPLVPYRLERDRRLPEPTSTAGVWVANPSPFTVDTPVGPVVAACQVKVFSIGSVSLTIRVPFSVQDLESLVPWHGITVNNRPLHEHLHTLAEAARRDIAQALIRPVATLIPDEPYTLFFIDNLVGSDVESWFVQNRGAIAGVLTEESDWHQLAPGEIEESTSLRLSYYRDDLIVVDWDAALAVASKSRLEENVYPMELANVQLRELEAYDSELDKLIERSYADIRNRKSRLSQEMEIARIDLARLGEMLENTGKLFGDWHLARIHRLIAERFHISDWQRSVEAKRETIESIHATLRHEKYNAIMIWLEAAIVVLFIIDIIPLMKNDFWPWFLDAWRHIFG